MTTIFFDPPMTDQERRTRLYSGAVMVFSQRPETRALCEHARAMIEEAFAPHDPLTVHEHMPVETCVAILAELKPRFIHHPRSKELIQAVLGSFGCDLDETFFDVPRLRTAMPRDYLASGIAYAFHPHRDTWYSAPPCQLNWWLPIYEVLPENGLAFHSRYWSQPVANGSRHYNYYRWNLESRASAALHVRSDTRVQPRPEEMVQRESEFRPICPPGGTILFSGAQLHETVPNTTNVVRYSIDFRTVHRADVAARRGAPNVDSACTGTTLRDFIRTDDFARLPEELVAPYDGEVPPDGVLIFQASAGSAAGSAADSATA
jgi:hypothetical protein